MSVCVLPYPPIGKEVTSELPGVELWAPHTAHFPTSQKQTPASAHHKAIQLIPFFSFLFYFYSVICQSVQNSIFLFFTTAQFSGMMRWLCSHHRRRQGVGRRCQGRMSAVLGPSLIFHYIFTQKADTLSPCDSLNLQSHSANYYFSHNSNDISSFLCFCLQCSE